MQPIHPLVATLMLGVSALLSVSTACWWMDCDLLYVHSQSATHMHHPPVESHAQELARMLGTLDYTLLEYGGRQTYALPVQSLNSADKCHRGRAYYALGMNVGEQHAGSAVDPLVHRCFPPLAADTAWLGDLDGNVETGELLVGVHGDSSGAPLRQLCLFSASNPQASLTRIDCITWPWDLRGDTIRVEIPEDTRMPVEIAVTDYGRTVELGHYPSNNLWTVGEYDEGKVLRAVGRFDRWMLEHGRLHATALMYQLDGSVV